MSPETVAECLGIVVAWSRLADEVAQTEFPEHELLACFRVFNLTPLEGPSPKRARPSATSTVPAPAPATQQDLSRLADAFKVDSTRLLDQFREHQRIAQLEFARTPGLSVAKHGDVPCSRHRPTRARGATSQHNPFRPCCIDSW